MGISAGRPSLKPMGSAFFSMDRKNSSGHRVFHPFPQRRRDASGSCVRTSFLVKVFLRNPIYRTEPAFCGLILGPSQPLQCCIMLFFHSFCPPGRSPPGWRPRGSRGLLCGLRRRKGPSARGWLASIALNIYSMCCCCCQKTSNFLGMI